MYKYTEKMHNYTLLQNCDRLLQKYDSCYFLIKWHFSLVFFLIYDIISLSKDENLRKVRYLTMTKLSTLQMRTLIAIIAAFVGDVSTFDAIRKTALRIVKDAFKAFPKVFPLSIYKRCVAFALSHIATKAINEGSLSIIDYLKALATIKRINGVMINDYGAFGDMFEILVRLAFVGNVNLFRASQIHVHEMSSYDMISRKYGKIEIGCNGKTFASGTALDYMSGDYNAVVYGVFADVDKQAIYNACERGDIQYAIDYVKAYTCIWQDKYQFEHDMQTLTRGKGITIKSGKIMVQYNAGKHNAFINAIESGYFTTLADIL